MQLLKKWIRGLSFRTLGGRDADSRRHGQRSAAQTSRRLRVEHLEDRLAPAVSLVGEFNTDSGVSAAAVVGDTTFTFRTSDGSHINEVWAIDDTLGTRLVWQGPVGVDVLGGFEVVESTLYFNADDGVHGVELWATDGTAVGTFMVADINPGTGSSYLLMELGGRLLFTVDGQLWAMTGGPAAGTPLVVEELPGPAGGIKLGSFLYSVTGVELWRTDGTAAGTTLIANNLPTDMPMYGFHAAGSAIYMVFGDPAAGYDWQVWVSDGTTPGTGLLRAFPLPLVYSEGGLAEPDHFTAVGSRVFFDAWVLDYGRVLLVTDGTPAGTSIVGETAPSYSYFPLVDSFMAYGDRLLYRRRADERILVSDGTEAGTGLFVDVPFSMGLARVEGSTVYFSADDGVHGVELWQTDGTVAGTKMVADILPGPESSYPYVLAGAGSTFYLAAWDGAYLSNGSARRQLWVVNTNSETANDTDGDGIADIVDPLPLTLSDDFDDGITSGTILSRGAQTLTIDDAPNAADGVIITASPTGGAEPAIVSVDGGAALLYVNAGDQLIVTHGSVILRVVAGSIETAFVAESGETATVDLVAGNGLTFKPDTFSFIAPPTNTVVVQVTITSETGEEISAGLPAGNGVSFVPETGSFVAPETNTDPIEITDSNGDIVTVDPGEELIAVNQAPIIVGVTSQNCTDTELTFAVQASDANTAQVLTYGVGGGTKVAGPGVAQATGFSIDDNGVFHWTPGAGQLGQYTFHVTVRDGHGGEASRDIVVTTLGVVDGMLTIVGTSGDDVIHITPTQGDPERFTVRIREIDYGFKLKPKNNPANPYTEVASIHVCGLGGDDQITVNPNIQVDAELNGGAGNDQLKGGDGDDRLIGGSGNDDLRGGDGDDILIGGDGDDAITGAAGNDFLVGGSGKDRLVGSAGNDILVAGAIDSSLSLAALREISLAWSSSRTVNDETIDDFLDETLGDASSDSLTGGAGADLFIINSGDSITDFQFGKPKANKDGDVVIMDGVVVV